MVFYLLCFYYTDKASGLLKNRKVSKNILTCLLATGLFFIVWFGIYIGLKVADFRNGDKEHGIDPNTLCFNLYFKLYRSFHIILCIAFYVIQALIKRQVNINLEEAVILTPYDKFLYDHQMKLLRNLRMSVYFFLASTLMLIIFDIASHLSASNHLCNSSFFVNDSLNALMYFISRSLSCFPAQMIVLYLFWQNKNKVKLLKDSKSVFSESTPVVDTHPTDPSRYSDFSHRQSVQTIDGQIFNDGNLPSPSGGFAIVR